MTTGTFGGFGGGGTWPGGGFLRLTWSGTFGAPTAAWEKWSFRLHATGVKTLADRQTLAEASRAAWATHLGPRIRGYCHLTETKVAQLGSNGKYSADPAINTTATAASGSSTVGIVPQAAVAVSLVTATRGPRGRGRFYLPAPLGGIITTSGLMDATDTTGHVNAAKAFLDAINVALGTDRVVIANIAGALPVVTGVRVGRRMDVIRSRAAQLPEQYTSVVNLV